MSPLFRPTTAALSLLVLAHAAFGQSSLQERLERAFASVPAANVELIQERKTPDSPQGVTYRLCADPKKGVMVRLLKPVLLEGRMTLDDRKNMSTYLPDKRSIRVQASPHLYEPSAEKLARLTVRNYNSKRGSSVTVAGRSAITYTLTPKQPGVGARTLAFDSKTGMILRIDLKDENEKLRLLDTFLFRADKCETKDFRLPAARKRETIPAPKSITSVESAAKAVGFSPRIPTRLPLGMSIYAKQVVSSGDAKFVALRLTDGLASMTVYQWNPKLFGGKNPVGIDAMAMDGYGIMYTGYGSLPSDAARRVVAHFVLAPQ